VLLFPGQDALGQGILSHPTLPSVPTLNAAKYILVESGTGYVIAERLANKPHPPASLTKVMSSYILADYLQSGLLLEEELVRISKNAWAQNPVFKGSSRMWIEPAKRVPLLDLYRGMVISSGNDAAVAVAEYISGSEYDFVKLLNTKARELGMKDTHFGDAHGLGIGESSSHTTAHDMAILARATVHHFPKYYKYYSQREFEYNGIKQNNRNILLDVLEGVDGIKTGYTNEAGYCLMSSAKRGDMRLIAVVLGADSESERIRDSRVLLEYGYRYYTLKTLLYKSQTVTTVRVYGGDITELPLAVAEDVNIVLPRGPTRELKRTLQLNPNPSAPITKGARLGTVHYQHEGKRVASVPLLATRAVHGGSWYRRSMDWLELSFWSFLDEEGR
jgi:D-alanyl-D-alanine carboxypeptidase (penicillin-binding protein 5/6)